MPANPPYIPADDAGFNSWVTNFSTKLTAAPTTYGLVAGDATAMAALVTTWTAAYAAAITPATRTPVTVAAKDTSKIATMAAARGYAVRIASNSSVSDANKTAIGVTVRVLTRTSVPAPAVSPGLALVSMSPMTGLFRYYNLADPLTKAVPYGAGGVEVWTAIGVTWATDPTQATYRGRATKAPFGQVFDGADVGKKLSMWVRYVNKGGVFGGALVGPWSDLLQTTII